MVVRPSRCERKGIRRLQLRTCHLNERQRVRLTSLFFGICYCTHGEDATCLYGMYSSNVLKLVSVATTQKLAQIFKTLFLRTLEQQTHSSFDTTLDAEQILVSTTRRGPSSSFGAEKGFRRNGVSKKSERTFGFSTFSSQFGYNLEPITSFLYFGDSPHFVVAGPSLSPYWQPSTMCTIAK